MYIIKYSEINKQNFEKILSKSREEIKWHHKYYPIYSNKTRGKINKEQMRCTENNQQYIDINVTISTIPLDVNGLNTHHKKVDIVILSTKAKPNHMLFTRHSLEI